MEERNEVGHFSSLLDSFLLGQLDSSLIVTHRDSWRSKHFGMGYNACFPS
jgi:hypothetical protein